MAYLGEQIATLENELVKTKTMFQQLQETCTPVERIHELIEKWRQKIYTSEVVCGDLTFENCLCECIQELEQVIQKK